MIKEELYVIVGGERKRVDLNTPSGIVLEFKNNLFGDLSKIEASHSYTFEVPSTANNANIFGVAEDIRGESSFVREKHKAEYIVDGMVLTPDANLYVSSYDNRLYKVVLTWNVVDGLEKIAQDDISLRDFEGTDYVADENYDFEADDLIPAHDSASWTTVVSYEDYDPNAKYQSIVHPMGVAYGRGEDGVLLYEKLGDVSTKEGALLAYCGALETASEAKTYYRATQEIITRRFGIHSGNPPVVPAVHLLSKIEEYYGLDLSELKAEAEYICVPLVKRELTEAAIHQNYVNLDIDVSFGNVQIINFFRVHDYKVYNNPNLPNPISYTPTDIYINDVYNHVNVNVNVGGGAWYSLRLSGEITVRLGRTNPVPWRDDREIPKIQVSFVPERPFGNNYHTKDYLYTDPIEIMSIEGEAERTFVRFDGDGESLYEVTLRYIFSPEKGAQEIKTDVLYDSSDVIALYLLDSEHTDFGNSPYNALITGSVNVYRDENSYPAYINLYKNLPDISCTEFIKAVCYAVGGSPVYNGSNSIGLIKNRSIIDSIVSGDVIDLTSSLVGQAKETKDVSVAYAKGSSDNVTMARTNYFLMKNDEVNEKGAEAKNKQLEDQYHHSYCKITLKADALEKTKTIYQSPFFGAFLSPLGSPFVDTGNGTDMVVPDNTILPTSYMMRWKVRESKPFLGVVVPENALLRDRFGGNKHIDDKVVGYMKIWEFPEDPKEDVGLSVMADIFDYYTEIKEYLKIPANIPLNSIYNRPIYLEQYNSYFAISKLQYSVETGIAEAYLIKLPPCKN